MRRAVSALVALALACGCGNEHSPAPSRAAATSPAPPATAPAVPTLAELVDRADVVYDLPRDATRLHGTIAVYLVARTGGAADRVDARIQDWSLLVVGDQGALRFEVGRHEAGGPVQFGTMSAAPAFPARPYDASRDAYGGAPRWKDGSPVLLAGTVTDVGGEVHAYVVTREDHGLSVAHVQSTVGTWMASVIELADDATITLPDATIGADLGDPIVLHVDERVEMVLAGTRIYRTSLRIGQRVGPLADEEAEIARDQPWRYGPAPDLPDVPPGQILASRRYSVSPPLTDVRVLALDGASLVMWREDALRGWQEELRVPIPRGARLDLR